MNYDNISFENWCDSVAIEEYYYGDVKKTMKAKEARKASSMTEVGKLIKQESPIIKLEGTLEDECKEKIKKTKAKLLVQLIGMCIPWVNLGICAWVIAEAAVDKNAISRYRMYYGKKKDIYLVRKDIDIEE